MSVPAAYLGVILIWTTTPLAIQWSGQGSGFLFGVTARMVIGVLLALALVALLRLPMAWHKRAWQTYLAAGIGIYAAMLIVYWSAQFIPSGWISVIFGLTPVITGVMATLWLGERALTPLKLLGMGLGLIGLAMIFSTGWNVSEMAWLGVAGVFASVVLHSLSTVLVKRIGYQANGLVITTGGLLVAVPLYLLTWFLSDSHWPAEVSPRGGASIVYLGVVGSVLGFAMFYYVLRHVSATRVALLTLITPVNALWLGYVLNGESVGPGVIAGTLLILSGLGLFEWGERRRAGFGVAPLSVEEPR